MPRYRNQIYRDPVDLFCSRRPRIVRPLLLRSPANGIINSSLSTFYIGWGQEGFFNNEYATSSFSLLGNMDQPFSQGSINHFNCPAYHIDL